MCNQSWTKTVGVKVSWDGSRKGLRWREGGGEKRGCQLDDSPGLPESDCLFAINEDGIGDPKEKDLEERANR